MFFTTLILSGKGNYAFKDFSESEEPSRSSRTDQDQQTLLKGQGNKCCFVGLTDSVELRGTSSAAVAHK